MRAGLPALAVAALAVALTLGAAGGLLAVAGPARMGPADWAALRFTLVQAGLSAVLSCIFAVPLARALHRRRFVGRGALVTMLSAPFVLPVLVAVLGLLAVFGRQGPANMALVALGLPPLSIFGLQGVVLAHVFLNLPLATRMILMGWQAVPVERFRLAAALGFAPTEIARHLEAPMLRAVLPGAFSAIFLVCLTSFAVTLTLGGGPGATTVELLIYQAIRFDFDLGHAAMLAGVQFVLSGLVTLLALAMVPPQPLRASGLRAASHLPGPGGWRRGADAAIIGAAALFVALPLLAVFLRALPGLGALPDGVAGAALRSGLVAVASALLASAAALALALEAARGRPWLELAGMLPLASSSLVMGTALFLATRPIDPGLLALPVTVLVNAALTLPYLLRLLLPEVRLLLADYARLAESLGLQGRTALRLLVLPRLRRPLAYGAGLAAALAVGDLGVISLFAGQAAETLPLMMARLMGAYRMEAAAGVALVLVVLAFALVTGFDRMGARDADA